MSWLLRATALTGLAWALAVAASLRIAVTAPDHAPLALFVASALVSGNLALSLGLLVGARNPAGNRTAASAAIAYLLCRIATDLYGVLRLSERELALLSLADLVLALTMATLIIEALPRALRP